MHSLTKLSTRIIPVLILLLVIGLLGSSCTLESVKASAIPDLAAKNTTAPMVGDSDIVDGEIPSAMGYFALYDGIAGESLYPAPGGDWIDVLSIEWGAHRPDGGTTGMSRRRGAVEIEDFTITFLYEKAAPKLAEKCLKGEVIPKLQIECTQDFDGTPKRYLKYELKNVMITGYHVSGHVDSGVRPTVTVSNSFEEIKVIYTEYDETGAPQGNVEFEYDVERGR